MPGTETRSRTGGASTTNPQQGTGSRSFNRDTPLGRGANPQPSQAPEIDPTGLDAMTAQLYSQLLGLMDQQANTDLANEQIGSLSNILNQQTSLAGKDLAAAGFASGSATPANIAPILQSKSQALAQGITQIQTAAQQRADVNKANALGMLSNLRGQLSTEKQQTFDNAMNTAMFKHQQWLDQQQLDIAQEQIDANMWASITSALLSVGGAAIGFAVGGPPGAVAGAAIGGAAGDR